MQAEQVRQDQLANDLSNASTPGYKSDSSVQQSFGSLLLANSATGQTIGSIQTGVGLGAPVVNTAPQPLQQTGQPLDFGIQGSGFFAVRTPQGVQYTRDGQFQENAQGLLVDQMGDQVLSQNGAPIAVGAGGKVAPSSLGVFNLTGAVAKAGNNNYTGTPAGAGTGSVRQGELEQSSVDPVQTMTDMITSLRTYQSGENAIQSIDGTMQESAQSVAAIS
jgi:flagellar basal-body rod protein FlgF